MKYFKTLLTVGAALVFSTSSAFATQIDNSDDPGSRLALDPNGVKPLQLGFSPSVAGLYSVEAVDGDEQWYAISTYHQGGTLFFGSASDQTSIFKQKRENNQDFDNVTVPEAPNLDDDGNPLPWANAEDLENTNDWYL
jgi:hypothetical protein